MNTFPARTNYQNIITAEEYDAKRLRSWRGRLFNKMEVAAVVWARRQMSHNAKVLELPCGTGRTLFPLVEYFGAVEAVDISEQMLSVARRRYTDCHNVHFVKADGVSLPFVNGYFDYSFSVRLFGHTPPDIRLAILRELARVTSKKVALMIYVRDPMISLRKAIQWKLRPPKGPWYPVASMCELRRIFGDVGLRVEQVRSLLPCVMESRMVIASKLGEEDS